jgi:AcrR family transcriptional regulator
MNRVAPESGSARREQRRVEHQDLSRAQLLDAAEEVFGRKGFYATTLKEVAELAGFSVGSVYSFFANKDDLFRQVYLRRGNEFMPALRAIIESRSPAIDVLHDVVRFQVQFIPPSVASTSGTPATSSDPTQVRRSTPRSWRTSRRPCSSKPSSSPGASGPATSGAAIPRC